MCECHVPASIYYYLPEYTQVASTKNLQSVALLRPCQTAEVSCVVFGLGLLWCRPSTVAAVGLAPTVAMLLRAQCSLGLSMRQRGGVGAARIYSGLDKDERRNYAKGDE
jgi:hypothetical protein